MKKVKIIGAGIAGCCSAYFLKKAGFDVEVFEKNTVCSGGSAGAGAFLSPKMSKPSPYKSYLNDALAFSLDFYEKNFSSCFKRVTLEKYPKDSEDWQKLQSYEEFIEFEYQKKDGYFELDFAGLVEPKELCYALLEGISYHENYEVQSLDEFEDSIIVIATPNQNFLDLPYLRTKNISGYRYDVRFDGYEKRDKNSHRELSISACFGDCVRIGATYIRGQKDIQLMADEDSFGLLKKAKEFKNLKNLKVLKSYTGVRNMSFDFFPVVGKAINYHETIKKYPYIKKGTKVPSSKYIYHDNIYLHTALGSRGFVYAPYNAYLLAKLVKEEVNIHKKLSCERLFKKYFTTADI